MATAHMHPHQSWQMQPGSVHGMSNYHPEHSLPHHQQWAHTPTTSMASYGNSPLALAPYGLVHQSPMQFSHQSQQQQHQHQHHHQQQPQQQHHHHHHHHQQQQQQHHPVRPQSSTSSLQSALPSALPSPVHPMSHSQAIAPLAQPTHSPISIPALGHGVLPMPLASPQQASRYNQPVPHQVVGQQGIRGVLPKSTGDQSSPEEAFEPEQETDGSWPCKFCGKKYRHAKHLRRHHARHTGETPYECTLCQRKFGRSDVLKRHYHKCATRRGVEVGDHLQGQRGHPRRRTRGTGADASDLGSPISNGHPEVKAPVSNGSVPMDGMASAWT